MPTKAEKLLERARQNKAGWSPKDLGALYSGFGFIIREGKGSHRIVSHSKYSHLRTVFPEHARELAKAYIVAAVKNIEAALELEKEASKDE